MKPTLSVTVHEAHLPHIPGRPLPTTHVELRVADTVFVSPPTTEPGINPHWNAFGNFPVVNENDTLVELKVWDSAQHELVGYCSISVGRMLELQQLSNDEETVAWVPLTIPSSVGTYTHPPRMRVGLTPHMFSAALAKPKQSQHVLTVCVLSASGLAAQGLPQSYVTVILGGYAQVTPTQVADNPIWKSRFEFPVDDENKELVFVVSQEGMTNPYHIGCARLGISELTTGEALEIDLPLLFPTQEGGWQKRYAELTIQVCKDVAQAPKQPTNNANNVPAGPAGTQYFHLDSMDMPADPYANIRMQQQKKQAEEEERERKEKEARDAAEAKEAEERQRKLAEQEAELKRQHDEQAKEQEEKQQEVKENIDMYNSMAEDVMGRLQRLQDLQNQLKQLQKEQIEKQKSMELEEPSSSTLTPQPPAGPPPQNQNGRRESSLQGSQTPHQQPPTHQPPYSVHQSAMSPFYPPVGLMGAAGAVPPGLMPDLMRMQQAVNGELQRLQDGLQTDNEINKLRAQQQDQQRTIDRLMTHNRYQAIMHAVEERQAEIAGRERDEIRSITNALGDMKKQMLAKQEQDRAAEQTRAMQKKLADLQAELRAMRQREAKEAEEARQRRLDDERRKREEEEEKKRKHQEAVQREMWEQQRQFEMQRMMQEQQAAKKAKASKLRQQAMQALQPMQEMIKAQNEQMLALQKQQIELEKQLASISVADLAEDASKLKNLQAGMDKVEQQLRALKHQNQNPPAPKKPQKYAAAPMMMIPVAPGGKPSSNSFDHSITFKNWNPSETFTLASPTLIGIAPTNGSLKLPAVPTTAFVSQQPY
eukprot:TRINITY_DN13050_c0_g1_i1.p1 TRINITY_DN13050_c0_g1~~TRINITY_DN13050_c0_g1_i1.p1  ORF type:complete len:819 (-),score=170.68 TRINITY_DN13050_c0_g1_i1:195-2651(-)